MKLNLPEIEKKILKFWQDNKIFEQTLEKTKKGSKFVFYEGPPFANGLPGIHHLLSRAFKDIILRYKTMQGFYVRRKAGWDTHGLPTEMETEKKLNIKNKKGIEEIGIEAFIKGCRDNTFTYKGEWEAFTRRMGYWVDLDNPYITCNPEYIESVWWILKNIWDKGLLYQDYKVIPYCPRCGTSLSSHEVAQGYKNIEEPAVYVKLELKTQNSKLKTYLLIWTTTPWTLPGNVAIAVNPKFTYLKLKVGKEYLILAKERLKELDIDGKITKEFKGKDLIGLKYKPLFKIKSAIKEKNIYKVIPAEFVSLEEGSGLVHIAPAFGEEDMAAGKKNKLPVLMTIDEEGKIRKEVGSWVGIFVKEADPLIIEELTKKKAIFKVEKHFHDYPFCWRCGTPLLYYAKKSWFIDVKKVKKDLIKNNQKINWIPSYLKEGRFGEWLEEVKDWNLSRERYWGTPLPVWQCEKCQTQVCIGSIEELNKKSGEKIKDLHRPFIDEVFFKCECGGLMKRVLEVIDCWFDSGSMPYAQWHYPFENKKMIDNKEMFPADFICEGIDQTRGWFYTLLAVSTLLGLGHSYKNVISHGIVLDDKGQKMSKSKGNIIKPGEVMDKFGADCARFYFYTINSVGEPKRFDFKELQGVFRRFFDTFWNSFIFFSTYIEKGFKPKRGFIPKNSLDKWIISKLESLKSEVIKNLEKYEVVIAARFNEDFVDDLSNWYIRRSRRRFQNPKEKAEKEEASQTLNLVLSELTKLLAPFVPFFAEEIYQQMPDFPEKKKSIHLENFPKLNKKMINQELEEKMKKVRKITALILTQRAIAGIKVRQPLSGVKIKNSFLKNEKELLDLLKEEVNVKEVIFNNKIKKEVELDLKITLQLKEEGDVREVIRQIQEMRKKAGYKPKDKALIRYSGGTEIGKTLERNKKFILEETKSQEFESGLPAVATVLQAGDRPKLVFDVERNINIDQQELWLAIRKI